MLSVSLLGLRIDLFELLPQAIHKGRQKKDDLQDNQASHCVMLTSQDTALLAAL